MIKEYNEALNTARRACSRCNAHKTFRPNEEDKEIASKAAKRAYKLINEYFDEARRKDETTLEEINELKEYKRLCLDAVDACKGCDKDRPLIKQMIVDVK